MTSLPRLVPTRRGLGKLPRYGSGWMYQFGHVYCLQQEMLYPRVADWFRACELWHTARHEGIALNTAHYGVMAQQIARAGQWEAALAVLAQLKRDAVRADAPIIGSVLAACADNGRWVEATRVYQQAFETRKLRPTEMCQVALAVALARGGKWQTALQTVDVATLPEPSVTLLLEAAADGCDTASAEAFAFATRAERARSATSLSVRDQEHLP